MNSVYSHTQDGTIISGSVADVIYAVEAGADIRIVDRCLGYGVRMDNMEVAFDRSLASGQSLWHVSERRNGPNLEFQGDDYWWFSVWSTDGTVDISRWNVGEHTKRGNSSMRQSMNWLVFIIVCIKYNLFSLTYPPLQNDSYISRMIVLC